MKSMYKYFV